MSNIPDLPSSLGGVLRSTNLAGAGGFLDNTQKIVYMPNGLLVGK